MDYDDYVGGVSMPKYGFGKTALPDHVKPKYEIGEYVVIVKDPVARALNGFAGKIIEIFGYNKTIFYRVVAENYGPQIAKIEGGGKRVRAWLRENVRAVPASALMRVSEAPDDAVYREVSNKKK
jgi:hypothetical protein